MAFGAFSARMRPSEASASQCAASLRRPCCREVCGRPGEQEDSGEEAMALDRCRFSVVARMRMRMRKVWIPPAPRRSRGLFLP